jgi:hypothetical protein
MNTYMSNEETKNLAQVKGEPQGVGRPLAFKSVSALQQAVDNYFDECDPHLAERMSESGVNQRGETTWAIRKVMTEQKPYLMSGLARHLNVDRKTLLNYSKKSEYFPTVEAAKARCEEFTEGQLYTRAATGAAFSLKNNFDDWVDRSQIDHTADSGPIALVEFIDGGRSDSKDPVSQ